MAFEMFLGEWQQFHRLLFCGPQDHYELSYVPRKKSCTGAYASANWDSEVVFWGMVIGYPSECVLIIISE